jgi:hypothetical protein
MPDVRRASYTLYQRSCIEDRSAWASTKRTSKMRSPGRPSSAVLASSWHPVACATQPDVPLPHDLVGDGLALGLLSHTLLLLPCVPRPRVQLRVDLRNLQAAHYTLPHHHDASAFITAICPHPQPSGTWQVDWHIHRSHRHLHTLDTDGFSYCRPRTPRRRQSTWTLGRTCVSQPCSLLPRPPTGKRPSA